MKDHIDFLSLQAGFQTAALTLRALFRVHICIFLRLSALGPCYQPGLRFFPLLLAFFLLLLALSHLLQCCNCSKQQFTYTNIVKKYLYYFFIFIIIFVTKWEYWDPHTQ